MLLDQPLPGSAQLQPRAVHQQMHRFGIAVRPRPRDLQGLGPAAQGGMVGNRESETKQANDRADQAFGLAQSQAEHGLERQGRQDGELGIPGLAASGGARLRVPGRDRLLREPDRQAPTLAQGGVVFGPVRDPAPLFRDMMAASSIGLERHRGSRVTEGVVHLRQPSPDANRPIRATNSLRAAEQDRPDGARHRRRWRVWQRYMDGDRFVFLDETGATTSMTRRYGWGERGDRLVDAVPYGP